MADDLTGVQDRTPNTEPRKITGTDGKTYTQSAEAPKRKARPVTDQFDEATLDLIKVLDRLDCVTESENYGRNKAAIATVRRSDIEGVVARLRTKDGPGNRSCKVPPIMVRDAGIGV